MGETTRLGEFWEEKRLFALVIQTQRKQDENASLKKGTKPWANTDKNYELI